MFLQLLDEIAYLHALDKHGTSPLEKQTARIAADTAAKMSPLLEKEHAVEDLSSHTHRTHRMRHLQVDRVEDVDPAHEQAQQVQHIP